MGSLTLVLGNILPEGILNAWGQGRFKKGEKNAKKKIVDDLNDPEYTPVNNPPFSN